VTYQTFAFTASSGTYALDTSTVKRMTISEIKMYKTLNTCSNQNIVTYPMTNQRYIIDYPEETYYYPDFYFSPVVCNDIFRFWY
jgi:hypothetical protein